MKLIKKILLIIKNLKNKETNHPKEVVINNCCVKNINWELINRLKKYDIVYVKMNEETIKKNKIEKEHQKRPFLITSKSEESIKGYYMTGNTNKKSFKKSDIKIILSKDKYNLKKNSLIKCDNEITLPLKNIEYIMDHLSEYDIEKLKKLKKIINSCNKEIYNTFLEIGFVVIQNEKEYIIYQKDNQFSYGYSIKPTMLKYKNNAGEKNPYVIVLNNKNYEIDYKDQKKYDNRLKYNVIDIITKKSVYEIDNNKKLIKKIKNCKKKNQKRPKC